MSAKTQSRLYVADTHSLAWYLLDSPQLSPAANRAFREVEQGKARLLVPAIVIAELIFITEHGKLRANIDELLQWLEAAPNFEVCPLDVEQLTCLRRQKEISSMHDRLIVCEALCRGAKLITRDEEIRGAALVPVVW